MTEPQCVIRLSEADDRGVPLRARCSCGWAWERPADDPWADTLPEAARRHPRAYS